MNRTLLADIGARRLDLEIDGGPGLGRHPEAWRPPASRYERGVFARYANSVSSASEGAVTS